MQNKKLDQIFEIFQSAGYACFLVGGTVRNFCLGVPPLDFDFAVSCPPGRTKEILDAANITNVPTGIEHGTITAVIDGEPFEITSFRRDIRTDGRHAITEFGGTLEEDAMRRDFTINALYMNAAREIVDPLKLRGDIEARCLRFVGDARARVQEDFLRILRFFRFYAEYDLNADEQALAACQAFAARLSQISKERIGKEMRKLMAGQNARAALDMANECSVLSQVLPGFDAPRFAQWETYLQANALQKDWRVETVVSTDALPREIWRLSNREYRFMRTLQEARANDQPPLVLGEIYGEEIAIWALHLRGFACGENLPREAIEAAQLGAKAIFPLNGNDLLALGFEGKEIGKMLGDLKAHWRTSQYALDKAALLQLALTKF